MRLLSLGAGVQSTTLALMACEGRRLEPLDGAIFADTGWEPKAVYDHLDRLRLVLAGAGIPLHVVSNGNLREDTLNPDHRYASIPYYIRKVDGGAGMGRRQCTSEYKLAPINRKIRQLLGAPGPNFRRVPRRAVAEQWIGFSADEIGRVGGGRGVQYIRPTYPLINLGMDRRACERWLAARGWSTVPKSACVCCPYRGNAGWRDMRDNRPEEWAGAVAFDEAIRKAGVRGAQLDGEAYLHRSLLPLSVAPIGHMTRKELLAGQADIFDLLNEGGDPDGCSPYACRSGPAVTR